MSEIYLFINSIAENKLLTFILSGLLGLGVNLAYTSFGFKWVNSINQRIIALIMAPAMTVIAWTIAGNLGLSLGMIGALSIVRFRTPVKSSLELIIYFIHIVIGISITVAPIYTLLIFLLTISAPYILIIFKKSDKNNLDYLDTYMNNKPRANFVFEGEVNNLSDTIQGKKITHFQINNMSSNISNLTIEINDFEEYENLKNEISKTLKLSSSEYIL